jgi:hypothetical protein
MDPAQTLLAVMIDSFDFDFHWPKPDGSVIYFLLTLVTHSLKTDVMLPHAHAFLWMGLD